MAYSLFGAKTLPESMLNNYQLDPDFSEILIKHKTLDGVIRKWKQVKCDIKHICMLTVIGQVSY